MNRLIEMPIEVEKSCLLCLLHREELLESWRVLRHIYRIRELRRVGLSDPTTQTPSNMVCLVAELLRNILTVPQNLTIARIRLQADEAYFAARLKDAAPMCSSGLLADGAKI